MDRENLKRKTRDESPMAAERSTNLTRGNKAKKTNPPADVQQQQHQQCTAVPNQVMTAGNRSSTRDEATSGSDLTQKLVAMWVAGTHGNHPFMTQEVHESMALRDAQQKCCEAENVARMLQSKMKNTESVINELNKSLKSGERLKAGLVSKLNLTGDLAAAIMEHINYITDTLQRCQRHKDHLSDLYSTITIKQKEDYRCLKNRKDKMHERINILQARISVLEENLEKARHSQEDESNQIRTTFEAELGKARAEYEKTRKQLEDVDEEKKKIQSRLTATESNVLEMEKKIATYQNLLWSLEQQLAKSSTSLESIGAENEQLKKQLAEKNREILQIRENLETTSTSMSAMSEKNNQLEEQIKREVGERESLSKSLEEARERDDTLVRQVEQLRAEKEEAVRQMRKLIDSTERECKLLSEAKKEIQDMASSQERILKVHVEKYESCLVEMKLLEARHQEELSRIRDSSESSNSALQNAAAENNRLEEAIVCLRREKNDLQVEMEQIENLLKKHANSEKQLRVKLEECQAEVARYAAAAAIAQAEKKRGENEKTCKIKELEKELLNLQFNRSVITASEKSDSGPPGDSGRKAKDRAKKSPASTSYKKSILKRDPKMRKTRSTPPSPLPVVAAAAAAAADRKITFNFDSSSEGSPVKLPQTIDIPDSMHSDVLFDDFVATGMSSSQPVQSSQIFNSQRQSTTRKFFKSRASQSK